jgi:hypothetical protein
MACTQAGSGYFGAGIVGYDKKCSQRFGVVVSKPAGQQVLSGVNGQDTKEKTRIDSGRYAALQTQNLEIVSKFA